MIVTFDPPKHRNRVPKLTLAESIDTTLAFVRGISRSLKGLQSGKLSGNGQIFQV